MELTRLIHRTAKAISTGGFNKAISNYEEVEEARIGENWEIMRRKDKSLRTILQKIGVMILTGGFIIKPKGEF